MATYAVGGVEKVEYAPASSVGVIAENAWKRIENISPGSVLFTKNVGTKTSIVPEDKDKAFVNFFAPAEGDVLTFAVLEENPGLEQELHNIKYTAATTTLAYKAAEKIANLAFRITTRPVKDARKQVITFFNTDVQTGSANNLTKDALQTPALTATIGTYRPAAEEEDFIYEKKWVTAAGAVIDSTAV